MKSSGFWQPRSDASDLYDFYNSLSKNAEFLRFSCTLNGTRSLVIKATAVYSRDIKDLPYPFDLEDASFSFWEQALCDDTNEFITDYVRLGQNSALLQKVATTADLRVFADLFVRMLGSIYDNLEAGEPIFLHGLTVQPFYFGDRPDFSWISSGSEDDLNKLIYDDETYESLRTIRVVRYYAENYMLLIKPDRLRYWIRSTAIRDADETLIDLRRQGY